MGILSRESVLTKPLFEGPVLKCKKLGDVDYVYYPRTGLSTTATNPTMKYSLALAILTTLTG